MALAFAHGAIQWLAADAATTVYTVSGLSFQPVALRFYWVGLASASDAASGGVDVRRGVGFAVSTSARRCVGTFSDDASAASACATFAANDCVVGTVDAAAARDGELDLNSITSDGFTLIVDDQGVVDITVFWEAWGGSDITVATVGDIAEPAAAGDVDYTVTGFVAAATDQVVMLAGVPTTAALNSAEAEAGGITIGFAGAGTSNIMVFGQADHASATMDTRGYSSATECLAAMGVGGAASMNGRAALTQFGTDNFRLNWIERGLTNRRNIFMAIKGGNWAIGAYTINGDTGAATATVSGLAFTPIGVCLMGRKLAADTADVSTAQDRYSLGSGSSTSSRRAMGVLDLDGTADSEINTVLEYDSVLAFPSTTGTLQASYDINAMNSDGFQIIVDTAGGFASEWQGYLTFGNAPTGRTTKNTRAWPLGTEIGMGWRMECAS
jgi:hypothetical protein